MKQFWRWFRFTLLTVLSLLVIRFNLQLHYQELHTEGQEQRDLRRQLQWIERGLKENNAGENMQELFPEGYFFAHVLYGLAWCEYANQYQPEGEEKQKAMREAAYALKQIEGPKGYDIFPEDVSPPYGVFYNGWCNYLRALILRMSPVAADSSLRQRYLETCDSLAAAFAQSDSPWQQSYRYQCWPSDATVAIASLALSSSVTGVSHDITVTRWVAGVRARLDPATDMIPHQAECAGDTFPDGPRGSSTVLMLRFLTQIDPAFAREQFNLFRKHFLMKRMGRYAIREYPRGREGNGDVDSGPVILDMGFSATIVAIGTANAFHEDALAASLSGSVEAFGFSIRGRREKKFIGGMLPVADAFIAWGRATSPVLNQPGDPIRRGWSVVWMHVITMLPVGLWLFMVYRRYRSRQRMKNPQ